MKYISFLIVLLSVSLVYSLPVTFSVEKIDFGDVEINHVQSQQIYIKNIYEAEQIIYIYDAQAGSSRYNAYAQARSLRYNITLSDTLFVIAPQDSVSLQIDFVGHTNVLFQTAIIFENQFDHSPVYMPFSAACYLTDDEYPTTFNLYDNALKNEIFVIINNHNPLSYNNAREQIFSSIDNFDGFVECIYT